MAQTFREWFDSWVESQKKKGISISSETVSEIDTSYKGIEEANLIIDGNEFPELKRLISCKGSKFEKVTLRNLTKLAKFEFWDCQIKEIEISGCPNLAYFDVRNNLLVDLYFLKDLKEKLTHLDVSNNNLKGWLPFLEDFKSLNSLFIGNRIDSGIIDIIQKDCLQGSLEKLRKLNKLEKIDISNTNIDSGLEYLSEKTEKIGCSCYYFWKRKCFVIKKQLENYPLGGSELTGEWYNFSSWRRDNQDLIQRQYPQTNDDSEEEAKLKGHEATQHKIKQQSIAQQITYVIHNHGQLSIGDNATLSNQSIYQQYNIHYQQLIKEVEQEINQSLINQEITPQDQKVINQAIIFLGAKELFINYRQAVLNHLIDCYCKLASNNKLTKSATATFNSVMGITSKLTKVIPKGGVAETPLGILGDTINLAKKCLKKFQEVFAKDKINLNLFDTNYQSLEKVIWTEEQSSVVKTIVDILNLSKDKSYPFSDERHNVFKVGGVWEQDFSNLDLLGLKAFLEKLDKSSENYRQEFQQQRKGLSQQPWFKAIETKTDLLQEQSQAQILQSATLPYGTPGSSK